MASDDDKDPKANLQRDELLWRARFDLFLHTDRAAVDIGLTAVRVALLINAGAVVALLAFVGQLWGEEGQRLMDVLRAIVPFVWGLISAAVAVGVAYFYQLFNAATAFRGLEEISLGHNRLKPQVWIPKLLNLTRVAMVALVILAYGFFLWGTLRAIDTMASG